MKRKGSKKVFYARSWGIYGLSASTWIAIAWILGLSLLLIAYFITKIVWFAVIFALIVCAIAFLILWNRYYMRIRPHRRKLYADAKDVLTNETAIKIFNYAKEYIYVPAEAIRRLGLTQKQYYTNLRRLMDAGLIERNRGSYHHTKLGTSWYKRLNES